MLPVLKMSPKAAPRRDFIGRSVGSASFRDFVEGAVAIVALQEKRLAVVRAVFEGIDLGINVAAGD